MTVDGVVVVSRCQCCDNVVVVVLSLLLSYSPSLSRTATKDFAVKTIVTTLLTVSSLSQLKVDYESQFVLLLFVNIRIHRIRFTEFTDASNVHRRSQDFVWGTLFPSKKLTTFFSSSPSKDGLKLLNQPLSPPNLPKMS